MRRILREFETDLGNAFASTNIIRPLLPSIPITSPDTLNSAITFRRAPRW
jgi:hypothetical protein